MMSRFAGGGHVNVVRLFDGILFHRPETGGRHFEGLDRTFRWDVVSMEVFECNVGTGVRIFVMDKDDNKASIHSGADQECFHHSICNLVGFVKFGGNLKNQQGTLFGHADSGRGVQVMW